MKNSYRILALVTLALLLFAMLTGCKDKSNDSAEIKKISDLLSVEPNAVTVTVKTEHDIGALTSIYEAKKTETGISVEYRVEEFAVFDLSGDELALPNDRITSKQGTATVKDGKITFENGQAENVDLPTELRSGIQLMADNLNEIKIEDGKLSARVNSVSALFGKDMSATDATIAISYSDTAVTSIEIVYTENNIRTTLTYSYN